MGCTAGVLMKEKIWSCKIGGMIPENLPQGLDWPMRKAIQRAFREITGVDHEFTFSGWGGELTEPERAAYENRLPHSTEREKSIVRDPNQLDLEDICPST